VHQESDVLSESEYPLGELNQSEGPGASVGNSLPIDGPPSTRMISLDEPPSSETGRT
jgi:hypothetical protein